MTEHKTDPDFGFYFETAGMSAVQGATSSSEEHFKEVTMAEALAREMGQNSLDARLPNSEAPVRMEFELRKVDVREIPDYGTLREHILAADEATREIDVANDRLSVAGAAAKQEELYVLRIGDYGTTGLTGQEDDDTNDSPLVALTRSRGISAGKDGKGGSFGVGAATGALASAIRTVLWTTLPHDSPQVVFAGQSQLATHILDGIKRGPDGFFINRASRPHFEYLRSPDPVSSFPARTEPGTDTYILGYLDAEKDKALHSIRDAFIRNFFVAIDRGLLEVKGMSGDGCWELNSKTIGDVILGYEDVAPFYQALKNEPIVDYVDGLGNFQLFVEFDDRLSKKLDTIVMRSPLMRVTSYSHTSIRAKYAAVFICEDEPGNTRLRKLEPPAHDKWSDKRADGGKQLVAKVKNFIKEALKSQLDEEIGEEIHVSEMDRLLPAGLDVGQAKSSDINGRPETPEDGSAESSQVHGSSNPTAARIVKKAKYRVSIDQNAVGGGTEEGRSGRTGGSGKVSEKGGDVPTPSEKGDGSGKIPGDQLTMRSWTESDSGDILLVLRSEKPINGSITLVPLSDGGTPERDFKLPIEHVELENDSQRTQLEVQGNTIEGIRIGENLSLTLRLRLSTNERFRLGIL